MIYKGKQPIITVNHIEDIHGNIGEVIEWWDGEEGCSVRISDKI
jgi:hypothetical protein